MGTIIQTGHSLAVVIPKKYARQLGLKVHDRVKLELLRETGQITYTFTNIRQLALV